MRARASAPRMPPERRGLRPPPRRYGIEWVSCDEGSSHAPRRLRAAPVFSHSRRGPRGLSMNKMIRKLALAVTLLGGILPAQDFDLVIANGRVMDPATNLDAT